MRDGVGRWLVAALLAAVFVASGGSAAGRQMAEIPQLAVTELPPEARATIALVRKGGPYQFERDGIVFGNFEKQLPLQARGYYREYTVKTPGLKGRGSRRIVAGRGGELYYTDDHYRSFGHIKEP